MWAMTAALKARLISSYRSLWCLLGRRRGENELKLFGGNFCKKQRPSTAFIWPADTCPAQFRGRKVRAGQSAAVRDEAWQWDWCFLSPFWFQWWLKSGLLGHRLESREVGWWWHSCRLDNKSGFCNGLSYTYVDQSKHSNKNNYPSQK